MLQNILPQTCNYCKRDKELLERSIKTLYGNIIEKSNKNAESFVFGDYKGIAPSPNTYKGVWNWDGAFHTIAMSYFDKEIAHDQIKILFEFMKSDGQIADVVYTNGKSVFKFTKPPVIAWAIMCSDKIYSDIEFLKYCYPYLLKNLSWWENERYDGTLFGYKVSKMESGWDNTVRFDFPNKINWCYAIDCNCFMVDFYNSMVYISNKLGKYDNAKIFENKSKDLSNKINNVLYNSKNKYYCDYNKMLNKHTNCLSPASFMPLFSGIASEEMAENMKNLAQNDKWFYPGIPTVSYNNRGYKSDKYWRGPCWLNTAYFTIKGLYNYGY